METLDTYTGYNVKNELYIQIWILVINIIKNLLKMSFNKKNIYIFEVVL